MKNTCNYVHIILLWAAAAFAMDFTDIAYTITILCQWSALSMKSRLAMVAVEVVEKRMI